MSDSNLLHADPKSWHAVTTKKIPYKKAPAILDKLGYSYYLPLQKQLHYWSDRKRWIDVPILYPYVFIFTNISERKLLFETCDFFRFLRNNGKLAVAKNEEIERIKLLCIYKYDIQIESTEIKKGDRVVVMHGPLAGMKGFAVQENGKHRFLVQIESLGKFASVEIDSNFLQAC